MNQIKTLFLSLLLLFLGACRDPNFTNVPGCDDTATSMVIQLNFFPQTSYRCASASAPPFAGGNNNYLSMPSATDIANIGTGYLCKVTVNSACTRSATTYKQVAYWTTAGPNLSVQGLLNEDTKITVEYYDICMSCNNLSARPYYVGVLLVKKGAPGGIVQMTNQAEKPC